MKLKMLSLALSSLVLSTPAAHAWGRRGHQIVGETAAQILGDPGLKAHSFDIGFYANVPDIIWKRPATYKLERPNHFMDLEKYRDAFKARPEVERPFALSRAEFEKKFPELNEDAGRSYWRVREVFDRISSLGEKLKVPDLKTEARFPLQLEWLVAAGILAHYIGDLAQPLHVTVNHDGDLTGQHGIHSFFEDVCADEAYPQLSSLVMTKVRAAWPAFTKKNADLDVLDLTERLTAESTRAIAPLLDIDKKTKREDVVRTCAKYRELMVSRMTAGALTLAELYRRAHQGWTLDNTRFFMFKGEPHYIPPGPVAD